MTNIAQIANVLQSMVLTRDGEMVLTPTYYVFKMYAPHQGATVVPVEVATTTREVRGGRTVPTVSATASQKDGVMNITLTNIDLKEDAEITLPLAAKKAKITAAEILTAKNITDYNDFGREELVTLKPFSGAKVGKDGITLKMPAKSVVNLTIAL